MVSKYRLAVTAGLDYEPATHKPVEVNGQTLRLGDDRATFDLNVRIQDYTGTFIGLKSCNLWRQVLM
jgi:hypothetical protein